MCRAAYAADPEVVDGIAAVVNGDIITFSQVRALVAPREKLLRSQRTGEDLVKKIREAREAALKDLIDRQLIIQAFKKENYQIPDHFVDQRMHEIIQERLRRRPQHVYQNAGGAKLYARRIQKNGDRANDCPGDAQ